MSRNYSNSTTGASSRVCYLSSCTEPLRCQGAGHIRLFNTWDEMYTHLEPGQILQAVNHFVSIGAEYVLLKTAEEEREAKRHAAQEEKSALLAAMKRMTPKQLLEARHAVMPERQTIVTQPMRSRAKGGKNGQA